MFIFTVASNGEKVLILCLHIQNYEDIIKLNGELFGIHDAWCFLILEWLLILNVVCSVLNRSHHCISGSPQWQGKQPNVDNSTGSTIN